MLLCDGSEITFSLPKEGCRLTLLRGEETADTLTLPALQKGEVWTRENGVSMQPSPGYANTDEGGTQWYQSTQRALTLSEAVSLSLIHILCEEIWQLQGFGTPIYTQPWPAYDPAALVKDEVEIAIQVNGKIKGRIMVPASLTREQGDTLREHEAVKAAVGDKQIVKFIFVPGRLLNIVVK